MATEDSPLKVHQISSESEGSDPDSDWDDSEGDPDYDMLEETQSNFSNLSFSNKSKKHVVKDRSLAAEIDPQVLEITAPSLDDEKFEKVQKTIKAGLLENLKVDECKMYLKKNGLRLTGNKDTLIQRIKEHLEIINGGGEKKYPPSSFVLNCKGDACTGDVVLFEQNVYEMFNIASRSASGPPCGKRIVAGRIVKESYGAAKQQHTFTIEVLWSKGEKPLPPLYPLLIKGRNLYRLKTLRQKWEDEGKRQKMLMEKHSRGSVARADREARIQEKERRKTMENRIWFPKKDAAKNQSQSHSRIAMSLHQPQETDISTNHGKSVHSKTVAMGSVHHMHNQQAWKQYHPFIAETNGFAERTYHRKPLANANHFHRPLMMPNGESYKQKQLCRHFSRGRCYFGDNCKFLHDLRDKGNV